MRPLMQVLPPDIKNLKIAKEKEDVVGVFLDGVGFHSLVEVAEADSSHERFM